ncbi:MAG: cation transporter, partial [Clostridia bacterium]|nr:cation transporter [Clostridia bacterium]
MDNHTRNNRIKLQLVFIGVGCALNLALFFVKLYIGLSTNSVSIYADSLNNGLDSIGCIAALAGIGLLTKKKSDDYPYGFGRAQNITDFLISVCVIVTGFYFGYISLERLMYPVPIWFSVKYAVILGFTAGIKILLGIFFRVADTVEVGGGLRTPEALAAVLDAGATRAIIGSAALEDPEFLSSSVEIYGDRI